MVVRSDESLLRGATACRERRHAQAVAAGGCALARIRAGLAEVRMAVVPDAVGRNNRERSRPHRLASGRTVRRTAPRYSLLLRGQRLEEIVVELGTLVIGLDPHALVPAVLAMIVVLYGNAVDA